MRLSLLLHCMYPFGGTMGMDGPPFMEVGGTTARHRSGQIKCNSQAGIKNKVPKQRIFIMEKLFLHPSHHEKSSFYTQVSSLYFVRTEMCMGWSWFPPPGRSPVLRPKACEELHKGCYAAIHDAPHLSNLGVPVLGCPYELRHIQTGKLCWEWIERITKGKAARSWVWGGSELLQIPGVVLKYACVGPICWEAVLLFQVASHLSTHITSNNFLTKRRNYIPDW